MVDRGSQGPDSGAGKRAYEARRAAKAGMSVERWKAEKDERRMAEMPVLAKASPIADKMRGAWRRLMDRAHKPL
ncbi:hypothetical protein [Nguyenibacter sp. L1]|uniref:hypothetical protein n=1 Tax=Nguyenibacter sp. L1 TaxID=3049350 RepID=UPI002B4A6926|nr:hypothetical protein [Nguyenibacter sp. L1]WRH87801.1 hypothetical protein QN315_17915 [Nguyenibacter sp. L1]